MSYERALRLLLADAGNVFGSFRDREGSEGIFPRRSIGITNLAVNLEIIYGAQSLRGRILSRNDLGLSRQIALTPLSP